MTSQVSGSPFEIAVLTIIIIFVIFLVCFVGCKIKQCLQRTKVVLKD